jgi:hypothetical protein
VVGELCQPGVVDDGLRRFFDGDRMCGSTASASLGLGDYGSGAGKPRRTRAAGLTLGAKALARLLLAEWRQHLRASLSLLRVSFWSYNLVACCLWVKTRYSSWMSDGDACGCRDLLGGVVSRDIFRSVTWRLPLLVTSTGVDESVIGKAEKGVAYLSP